MNGLTDKQLAEIQRRAMQDAGGAQSGLARVLPVCECVRGSRLEDFF